MTISDSRLLPLLIVSVERDLIFSCDDCVHYGSANNEGRLGVRILRFSQFNSVFVHTKCTSNMVACYHDDVNKVTAVHVIVTLTNISLCMGGPKM